MPEIVFVGKDSMKNPLLLTTVALGAFLIFLIQPLAARALLPTFGGSASVWVMALVFYQSVLAAGYLLAYLIHTRLRIPGQTLTLVLLSTGALLTLTVLPKPIATGSDSPGWQLLLSLAVSVGPPFLVLAVAGPLIQGWAAIQGGGKKTGQDIYFLYAISNGASLLALAGYPFLIEPLWGILQQSRIWDGLFVTEVLLLIVISWRMLTAHLLAADPQIPDNTKARPGHAARRRRPVLWLSWSAAGVMVLTSTSGFIGQEIAAVPLFWVIPLTLYLGTWILAFSGAVRPGVLVRGCLALGALAMMVLAVDIRLSIELLAKLGLALTGMTLACFTVHASLYRQRPEKRFLTHFYASVATGGAIGGILAGVVAMQVFKNWRDLALAFSLVGFLSCAGLVVPLGKGKIVGLFRAPSAWLVILLAVSCCHLFVIAGMERSGLLYKHRDFHGIVRVFEKEAGNPQRHRLEFCHGMTLHGIQFLDPGRRGTPTTYFGRGTGGEIAVLAQRALIGKENGLDIGVVGLGIGTMAAHLQAQDSIHFYELSPVVAELALGNRPFDRSGHRFSFLRDAPGEVDVTVGDARLSLAKQLAENPGGNSYDLMVLDAFAGDAVPIHLLTREAFSLFTAHLSDQGMIAVHVSSNWLDLIPVVYAWADSERWQALTISTRGNADGVSEYPAVWVLLFRDQPTLRILADHCLPLIAEGKIQVQNMQNVNFGNLRPWTDDRSDLLALIRSHIRLREGPESTKALSGDQSLNSPRRSSAVSRNKRFSKGGV